MYGYRNDACDDQYDRMIVWRQEMPIALDLELFEPKKPAPSTSAQSVPGLQLQQMIKDAVRARPLTSREIAEQVSGITGYTFHTVKRTVIKMRVAGDLKVYGRLDNSREPARYGLAEDW